MNHRTKAGFMLLSSGSALTLLASPVAFSPARAQPMTTYNTAVFQFWTLNGEALFALDPKRHI